MQLRSGTRRGTPPVGAVAGGYLSGVLYGDDKPDITTLDLARVKRDEWFRYHEQVTPWEVREYLTRF